MRRLAPSVLVLGLSLALLQACGSGNSSEVNGSNSPQKTPTVATDPSAPGPYPVGVTEFSFERPTSTAGEPRILDTVVWYPAAGSTVSASGDDQTGGVRDAEPARDLGPRPIIVWSHGAGGTFPYSPLYYAPHLASYGFVVIAPSHPGNLHNDCTTSTGCTPEGMIDSYLNRPDDLRFALSSMLGVAEDPSSPFYHLVDGNRAGVSGHSFGATDTARMAETAIGSPFSAALAMAPCVENVVGPPTNVTMPLMMMGGDFDPRCPVPQTQTFFDGIRSDLPHFLVVFPRGGHGTYADECTVPVKQDGCTADNISQDKAHQLINFYATAFFETYVAGEQSYAAFLDPAVNSEQQDIRYSAHMP